MSDTVVDGRRGRGEIDGGRRGPGVSPYRGIATSLRRLSGARVRLGEDLAADVVDPFLQAREVGRRPAHALDAGQRGGDDGGLLAEAEALLARAGVVERGGGRGRGSRVGSRRSL